MASVVILLFLSLGGVPSIRLVNPATVVVTVAQEAIGRLARRLRQMRVPSNLAILDLPLEIILMIATHIDESSLVSLTLTCRSL